MILNQQQAGCIDEAVKWYRGLVDGNHARRVFRIGGFAGVGKTTVAMKIAEATVGLVKTQFIAPTGKASARLRDKGCKRSKTFHQFVYKVAGEDENGEPIFVGKGTIEDRPRLIICDESSMVGAYDARKLESHGIPVIYLGDPGQVPPVGAEQIFSMDTCDYIMDEIMRQNKDSNIIKASMFIRQGKRLPAREYDDVKVRFGTPPVSELNGHSGEEAVILCSYNNTRGRINRKVRHSLGFKNMIPEVGEKVICTSNQHDYGCFNGEQFIVLGYEQIPTYDLDVNDPDGMLMIKVRSIVDQREFKAKFNPESFSIDEAAANKAQKDKGGWDYGYALTIWKAQGSEWERVLLIEEPVTHTPYHQLIYTGVTRAAKQLTMYRKK